MNLSENIKQKARDLGFDLVGITGAEPIAKKQIDKFLTWLDCGYAGRMSYIYRNIEKRMDPGKLVCGASSVICVGLNYYPGLSVDSEIGNKAAGRVANYAQYEDYHIFMKERLRMLVRDMVSTAGEFKFKICVDSVPVAERALAVRAGLGFIGKNHMLINPKLGGQILLGEIITTLDLEQDKALKDMCSDCHKCISACPTGALRKDGQFDSNRCISYLTVEYNKEIPRDLSIKIGDRLFGCDDCILACPYQANAPSCENRDFKFDGKRAKMDLRSIVNLSQKEFEAEFGNTVLCRLGLENLKRNAKICLTNKTKPDCSK